MVALTGRSRILVAGVLCGLAGALGGWPWAASVAEAWASHTAAPGWGLFWLAWTVLGAAALGAGALGGDRRSRLSGAAAGALAAALGSWFGLYGPLALRAQWPIWAMVHEELVGRAAVTVALADTASRSFLWGILAGWVALISGALLGGLGAHLRGVRDPAPSSPGPAAWMIGPALLTAITWTTAFVGLIAVHQLTPALEAVPGAEQVVPVNRLFLVNSAALTAMSASVVSAQGFLSIRRSETGWRVFGALHLVPLLLLIAVPWTHTWFAPSMGWLRQWPVLVAAPWVGIAMGVALAWRLGTRLRQPTLGEWAEEALVCGVFGAFVAFGPGGFAPGQALAAGVAPVVPMLDTGLGTVPSLDPLPAFAVAPRALLGGLLTAFALAVVAGLPLRWGIGPPRQR